MASVQEAVNFILKQQKIGAEQIAALSKILSLDKLKNIRLEKIEDEVIHLNSDLAERIGWISFGKYVREELRGYVLEVCRMPATESYIFFVKIHDKNSIRTEAYLPVESLLKQKQPSAPTSDQYQ